jgi:hypothetical protein
MFVSLQEARKQFLRAASPGKKADGAPAHKWSAAAADSKPRPQPDRVAAAAAVASSGRDKEIEAIKELLATPELVLPHLLTGAKVVANK